MTESPTPSDLQRYPRPSLAVDVALLTVVRHLQPALGVVLVRQDDDPRGAGWCLPGTFVHERELLGDAVQRVLRTKAGLLGIAPAQLHVYDAPDRDPRGWVVSVAHRDTVRAQDVGERGEGHDVTTARVQDVDGAPRAVLPDEQASLPYDHTEIVERAVADLRRRYQEHPDPAGFLPEPFTLLQLRLVHEAVLGKGQQKDTFRRKLQEQLAATGERTSGTTGRPAELFRRASDQRALSR